MIISHPHQPISSLSLIQTVAQTAAWTLKSESYIVQMASDKGFQKVTQKFMKETSKKRTKTILHNSAGTYVYSGGRLRHTLLPSEVSYCPDLSGDDKDYMLANTSSKFGIMRPCIISMTEVGATVLYFVSESEIPAEIKDDYHVGTPFVKTTAAAASLSEYFPTGAEATPHVLISVPVNLPIDGGMTLTSGVVEDDVYQTLQATHGSYGKLYLDAMVSHNVDLQAKAITNKLHLKDHYPNRLATGTVAIPSSNITILYTTPDMEETLASELVGLQRKMPASPTDSPAPGGGIPINILAGVDTNSGKATHMHSGLHFYHFTKTALLTPIHPIPLPHPNYTIRDGSWHGHPAKDVSRRSQPPTSEQHPVHLLHGYQGQR